MKKKMLITGGAGFIGCNSAYEFAKKGWKVTILDNLSRARSKENLRWLKKSAGGISFIKADVRDAEGLSRIVRKEKPDAALHLSAQVAVTTSITDPRHDFEVNALGSFNLLEALRAHSPDTFLVYSSTNKVYGALEGVPLIEKRLRYVAPRHASGIGESQLLDFHSPYGCSKGTADQYVLDYSRIYGLRTTVFRQSCIYGRRQFGVEDQGWIAWFIIAAVMKRPVTVYGDGKQVRDVLFVDDLVNLYDTAVHKAAVCSGQAYNIGGGPKNTLSLLELIDHLRRVYKLRLDPGSADWRAGDQRIFVADLSKVKKQLRWSPKVSVAQGIQKLVRWVTQNKALFSH